MQRRMGVKMAGLVAVLGLGLAGCGASNTPQAYEPIVEKNFLEGCTNRYVGLTDGTTSLTDNTIDGEARGGTEDACRCMYDVFVEQVPFNGDDQSKPGYSGPNFTQLNRDLGNDNPGEAFAELPEPVRDSVQRCQGGAGGSTDATTATTEVDADTTATTA